MQVLQSITNPFKELYASSRLDISHQFQKATGIDLLIMGHAIATLKRSCRDSYLFVIDVIEKLVVSCYQVLLHLVSQLDQRNRKYYPYL